MSVYAKIRGTIETAFRIGNTGPLIKNNGGIIEIRNLADAAFAILRAAMPQGLDDVITLKYLETYNPFVRVVGQADCTTELGANTGSRGIYVVTTAGSGAVLGDLLYDNGTGVGTREIITALANRSISIPVALAGGTIAFDADSIYTWDADGNTWIKIGDVGSTTGSLRELRKAINTSAANQDTTFLLPANARVRKVSVEFTTPYNASVTLSVGTTSAPTAFMDTTENNPQSSDTFEKDIDVGVGGSAIALRCALGNTLSSGAGIVTVWFTVPN